MAITNGYATLAQAKERLFELYAYTALTISFATATSKISDTANGLRRFLTADKIEVDGSTSNDGIYTVTTGNVPAEIVVSEALTDEVAGDTVTITKHDPTRDAIIESMVEAVSRSIDDWCGRVFYTSATTARYYTATDRALLFVDDLISIDANGLVTDEDGDRTYENTWATTDYILLPENAATDGKPYTMIQIDGYQGDYCWPVGIPKGVKITGTWGYAAAVPKNVKEACLLMTEQLYKRKDAIFGTVGSIAGEQVLALASDIIFKDPHLQLLLAGVKRLA